MKALVNQSGIAKSPGARSKFYNPRSDPAHVDEIIEVKDPMGEIVNLARVEKIEGDQVQIVIVA